MSAAVRLEKSDSAEVCLYFVVYEKGKQMQVKLRAGNQFQKLSAISSMADSLILFYI